MKNYLILLILSLLVAGQPVLASEISAEKKLLVDKVLEQTGQSAIAVGKQFSNAFIQQMTIVLKNSNPDIDPKAYEIIEEEVIELINEEMIKNNKLSEMMYPIYDKHFTEEDLKTLIDLNNTPFGKKMIRVMPLITQEGMQAGQALGKTLVPKIQQRLRARFEKEGITLK